MRRVKEKEKTFSLASARFKGKELTWSWLESMSVKRWNTKSTVTNTIYRKLGQFSFEKTWNMFAVRFFVYVSADSFLIVQLNPMEEQNLKFHFARCWLVGENKRLKTPLQISTLPSRNCNFFFFSTANNSFWDENENFSFLLCIINHIRADFLTLVFWDFLHSASQKKIEFHVAKFRCKKLKISTRERSQQFRSVEMEFKQQLANRKSCKILFVIPWNIFDVAVVELTRNARI